MFRRFTDPALKRLYKFVLKRLIGRFLVHELDLSQLDVRLRAGNIELKNLELNVDRLNEHLVGLPFHVTFGFLGTVKVHISYAQIMTESCLVEIDQVELRIAPNKNPSFHSGGIYQGENNAGGASDSTEKMGSYEDLDTTSREGLDVVASWIEQISSRVQVTFSNVAVSFEDPSNSHEKVVAVLGLEWAQLCDETPMEQQAFEDLSLSVDGSAKSMRRSIHSLTAGSLFGITHKGVKFKGLRIDLLSASTTSAVADINTTVLASDISRQSYVQLKMVNYESVDAPQLDADVFMHSIKVQLQPIHVPLISSLVESFSSVERSNGKDTFSQHMYYSVCDTQPTWLQQTSDEKPSDENFQLSMREFKRIEDILHQYQKTHLSLSRIQTSAGEQTSKKVQFSTDLINNVDTVESGNLSDLDDVDEFYECGSDFEETIDSSRSRMDTSMYFLSRSQQVSGSVNGAPQESSSVPNPPRGRVQLRCKIHILESSVEMLYENSSAANSPASSSTHTSAKSAGVTMQDVKHVERLVVSLRDILCSAVVFPSKTTSSLSLGQFNIAEYIIPKHSIEDGPGELIRVPIIDIIEAESRSVHANAQITVQAKFIQDQNTKLSSSEVQPCDISVKMYALPLNVEWDMSLLVRLQNYLNQDKGGKSSSKKALSEKSKKLFELHTDSVKAILRFPLVPSDRIRYGPSSIRGLSEDCLVLNFDQVVVTSKEDAPAKVFWFAKYVVAFPKVVVSLHTPPAGNQRSTSALEPQQILAGFTNTLNSCSLSIHLQDIQKSMVVNAIARVKDILEDPLSSEVESSGARVEVHDALPKVKTGTGEIPQDCSDDLEKTNLLEQCAREASEFLISVDIPFVEMKMYKDTYTRLLILVDALLVQMATTDALNVDASPIPSGPCYMTFDLRVSDGSLHLVDRRQSDLLSYLFAFDNLRVVQVSNWFGQMISRVSVLAEDFTLFEVEGGTESSENKPSTTMTPVLYRTALKKPTHRPVDRVPILFLTVEINDSSSEMRDMNLAINSCELTLRYDPLSQWLFQFIDLIIVEYPLPVVPLDTPFMSSEQVAELCTETVEIIPIDELTIFTRLFVNCYRLVIDYAPTALLSRAVLVIGSIHVSTNLVTGAKMQGYKFMVHDLAFYLTNHRTSYLEEDSILWGGTTFLRLRPSTGEKMLRSSGSTSMQDHLESRGFIQIGSLDLADVFLRDATPTDEEERRRLKERIQQDEQSTGSIPPELAIELTLGTAHFYTCYDSCNSFIEIFSIWWCAVSSPKQPLDATAYVGLNKVVDPTPPSLEMKMPLNSHAPRLSEPPRRFISGLNTLTKNENKKEVPPFSILNQIEENAFGFKSGSSITHAFGTNIVVPSDVEARLLQTQRANVLSESRPSPLPVFVSNTKAATKAATSATKAATTAKTFTHPSFVPDNELSASQLRQRYTPTTTNSIDLSGFLIPDYYTTGTGKSEEDWVSKRSVHTTATASTTRFALDKERSNPWFKKKQTNVPSSSWVSPPEGESIALNRPDPSEQVARWLRPSGETKLVNPLARLNKKNELTGQVEVDAVDGVDEKGGDEQRFAFEALEDSSKSGSSENDDDVDDADDVDVTDDVLSVGPRATEAMGVALRSTECTQRWNSEESGPLLLELKERELVEDEVDVVSKGMEEEAELFAQRERTTKTNGGFTDGSKSWWRGQAKGEDVELPQFELSEGENENVDVDRFQQGEENTLGEDGVENEPSKAMSMSFMGSGDDQDTEVELDFHLDHDMQSKLVHLLDIGEHSAGEEEMEEEEEEIEDQEEMEEAFLSGSCRESAEDIQDTRLDSLELEKSSHEQSSQWNADLASSQQGRWFYHETDLTNATGVALSNPPLRIFPHHVEVPISGSAGGLAFGEREADYAIKSSIGDTTIKAKPSLLITQILLRDFCVRWRLFGGYDWDKNYTPCSPPHAVVVNATTSLFNSHEKKDASSSDPRPPKREKLLDALLDNYEPQSEASRRSNTTRDNVIKSSSSAPVQFGSHFPDQGKSLSTNQKHTRRIGGRKTEQMLEILLSHLQLRLDMFDEDEEAALASSTVLAIRDFEVLDYISTSHIRKLLCYWKSDTHHPRVTGTNMLWMHLMAVRPGPKLCEEHRLRMQLLPLRVNLDSDVVDFLKSFFPSTDARSSSSAKEQNVDVAGSPQKFRGALSPQNSYRVKEADVNVGTFFLQSCDIRSCKVKIDYRPQRVDYAALRNGDYLEIINLFVLDGMELVLRRIKLNGLDGWSALGEAILASWVNDISRHQIHKCVASVSMPPMRSMSNLGSGVADLILLPMEQYNKDRRLVRGLKKGAQSFLRTVTIETLNTASKMARGTHALLEHADDVVSMNRPRAKQYPKLPRNDRRGNRTGRYLASQPGDATEGFSQAYDSLSRELQAAVKTIVAIPLIEYKRTGPQGYVKSIIRAVPVAVLRPAIGATDALSRALIGVRNAVDPEMKEDMENKFKEFTV